MSIVSTMTMTRLLPLMLAVVLVGGGTASARSTDTLQVVAAENFWGSIAAQLGGDRVHVTSVITNPATDPHDYEPTAADARTLAGAQLLIANGIGYDPWVQKLADANPVDGRVVLTVGDLVGLEAGANPHRWYSPTDVQKVIKTIAGDLSRLDPKDARYFKRREASFETRGLAKYKQLIATIRKRYGGVPVGASESIFEPLAQALGLKLVTPPTFLKAISEGAEPTASDITTIDRQVAKRQIKLWVYNSQNSTPDVARITDAARKRGIPIATITETLSPASASFQQWQVTQLEAILAALKKGTGH
jgi:zinc/manganese transport system substrate-binding protein